MQPLNVLPFEIQRDFMATLQRQVIPQAKGHFYLTDIKTTAGVGYQGQRITVAVVDENGFPITGARVAFSYSTADQYLLTQDFLWTPPPPPRAFLVPTEGGGQIDMVLGAEGMVKAGQPGGVSVYILEANFSSDVITGLGMLADHSGVILTMQLQRNGVKPFQEQLDELAARVAELEAR